MKSKYIIIIVILLGVGLGFILRNTFGNKELVNPSSENRVSSNASPLPTPPVEIKFGQNTNLKTELELVNPEILDSDFDQLSILVKSF